MGVDVVEFGGSNQCVHRRGALTTTLGAYEEPGLPAESHAAQGALGGIVCEANPSIVDEPREAGPMFRGKEIVDGLGHLGMFRQKGALAAQPLLQVRDQRGRLALSHLQTRLRGLPDDPAFDLKQRVDALHCLDGNGRELLGRLTLADVRLHVS